LTGIIAALFIDTSKTVQADEDAENNAGVAVTTGTGSPALARAGGFLGFERHQLRRPLRWRK
jgi:hypothetical protein